MDDKTKELEKIKKLVEDFKDKVLQRFEEYIHGIVLLPPNKEEKDKINIMLMLDDSDSTKMSKEELKQKLTKIIGDIASKVSKKLNPQIVLATEFVQNCYDNKGDIAKLIANSATVFDKGLLTGIKTAEIHKAMVLEKFEKYIVSYVMGGSMVTDKAHKDSDIDVFIVIDDTDVKKMSRIELKDKLRSIIIGMSAEAKQLVGTNRDFHVQVYILTDFWDNVKEANPVIFTFLRDGIPLYDRGLFMPWKQLLAMGRIKPSQEAIDMMISSGEQFLQRVDAKFKEIGSEDFFWATITISQAAIMLYGLPPPTPSETADILRDVFVKKEKLMTESDVKIYEKIYTFRKNIERGKITKVSGKDLDNMYKETKKYLIVADKLFKKIQAEKINENFTRIDEDLKKLLEDIAKKEEIAKKESEDILKELIKKDILPGHLKDNMKDFLKIKKAFKKSTKQEIGKAILNGRTLIKNIIEAIQRRELINIEKFKVRIKTKKQIYDMLFLEKGALFIKDPKTHEFYLIDKKPKLIKLEEFEELMGTKKFQRPMISSKLYEQIKDILKEEFEIIL